MPGPLNGFSWITAHAARLGVASAKAQGYLKTDYRGREYVTRHGNCMNGANCTGPGCRVNRGQ